MIIFKFEKTPDLEIKKNELAKAFASSKFNEKSNEVCGLCYYGFNAMKIPFLILIILPESIALFSFSVATQFHIQAPYNRLAACHAF